MVGFAIRRSDTHEPLVIVRSDPSALNFFTENSPESVESSTWGRFFLPVIIMVQLFTDIIFGTNKFKQSNTFSNCVTVTVYSSLIPST